MATMQVTVRETNGTFEGSVGLPGLRTTKLVRKDGSVAFPNTSALKATARSLATRLGLTVEYVVPAKKAAKKSAKCCKSTKPTKSCSGPCSTPATPATPTA